MTTFTRYQESLERDMAYEGLALLEELVSSAHVDVGYALVCGAPAIIQELHLHRDDRARQHRRLTTLLADVVLAPQEDLIELRKRIEALEIEYHMIEPWPTH